VATDEWTKGLSHPQTSKEVHLSTDRGTISTKKFGCSRAIKIELNRENKVGYSRKKKVRLKK
jgi:hypothetical protein